jgi:Ca2+-binding RTX toxin-like protein
VTITAPPRPLGSGDNDTIEGGQGRDNLAGDSQGVVVSGRGGNDTLDGGPDDDLQIAGDSLAGNLVSGDGGNDTITGGPGNDAFLFADNGVFTCEGVITGDGGDDTGPRWSRERRANRRRSRSRLWHPDGLERRRRALR